MSSFCLRKQSLEALVASCPERKSALVRQLHDHVAPFIDVKADYPACGLVPGRPELPVIVAPQHVKHRGLGTVEGRAALIHALAHIEFNAVNLALDIIWRFPSMPTTFYGGWLSVAYEEVLHFNLLSAHLQKLGFNYGSFTAHDGLWDMAEKTKDDLLARLALVPRTLEARGLDACPVVRAKLANAGDHEAAAILDIILRDEVGHVALGNYWYRWLCEQQQLDPVALYPGMAERYDAPRLRGPFNKPARLKAGFVPEELAWLEQQAL